jgi:nitrous oxide reductase
MTMSGHEDMTAAPHQAGDAREPTPRPSRRKVLRGAATAGIAATALAAAGAPALAAVRPAPANRGTGRADEAPEDPGEAIVVHLRDARSGEIDVFRGTSQTRLRDPALAALLIRASK